MSVGRISEAWSEVAREAALRKRRLKQGQKVKVRIPKDSALASMAESYGVGRVRVATVVDPMDRQGVKGSHPLLHLGPLGQHEIPHEWITHHQVKS